MADEPRGSRGDGDVGGHGPGPGGGEEGADAQRGEADHRHRRRRGAAAKTLRLGAAGTELSRQVTFIDRQMVAAGFEKGKVLANMGNYMVHASHRDMDGVAEIHTLDTDLIYMLAGAATLVTGGAVPDAKAIEPNEFRGAAIVGGDSRLIGKGDVVPVPAGVPHMFTEV